MSSGHTALALRSHDYCQQCKTQVIPSRSNTCSWCDTKLATGKPSRRERLSMQRAYEITLLVHGGKA
jgi:hypothetical protein